MKKHFSKIALLAAGAGLVIAMLYLPKQPQTTETKQPSGLEAKIAKATMMVEGGQNPMEGIALFREILEEDPDNIEVHYRLGLFSLQSGQMDKAVMRFEKVLELNGTTYPDARFYLGQAYEGLGEKSKAIEAYTKYKQTSTDTVVTHGVDRLINELSNKN
ncbi:MAG: tetratricopeptide repeat protein [Bacteroidota bacterium]